MVVETSVYGLRWVAFTEPMQGDRVTARVVEQANALASMSVPPAASSSIRTASAGSQLTAPSRPKAVFGVAHRGPCTEGQTGASR